MDSYRYLSAYYDRFTDDVGYEKWADYFEEIFAREKIAPTLLLDLACGTGSITAAMARRGYEVIGVDASEEMLMHATNNTIDITPRPMFVQQRMEKLELNGTVDVCLCCLDSINYITDPDTLLKAFHLVATHLEPQGLFVFDINTPYKFECIRDQSYVREDEDVYCVWQCFVEAELCKYEFDIFKMQSNATWRRYEETHTERIYTPQMLKTSLVTAGFEDIHVYSELSFEPAQKEDYRLFFTARKRNIIG